MGNGYVRQSSADIVQGNIVNAGPINNEFNALRDAFDGNLGHSHDGTVGEGPLINLTNAVTGTLPAFNGGTGVTDVADLPVSDAVQEELDTIDDALEAIDGDLTQIATDMATLNTALGTVNTSITTHSARTDNPHSVTKAQVGLANADNTSDADKPVSTATQTAITNSSSSVLSTIRGGVATAGDTLNKIWTALTSHTGSTNNPHGVTKAQVGLGNADNTSDANKPVSTATQTALNTKANTENAVTGIGRTITGFSWDQIYVRMNDNSVRRAVSDISGSARMAMHFNPSGWPIIRVDNSDFNVSTREYADSTASVAQSAAQSFAATNNNHDVREMRFVLAQEVGMVAGWNYYGADRPISGIHLTNGMPSHIRTSQLQGYSYDRGWFAVAA